MTSHTITLSRKQLEAVNAACELYARVSMGQLRYLAEHAPAGRHVDTMLALANELERIEPMATLRPPNAYPGIAHADCGIVAQRAWEVYEATRGVLAKSHEPGCICVWHNPQISITREPAPKCQ